MRALIGTAAAILAIASFSQLGGASEPVSTESSLVTSALTRGEVAGCSQYRIVEQDAFLKRIGIVCQDGQAHWISHDGALRVDGRAV